jgi:predicted alpha/beta-hydrolase family hydrolase
MPEPVTVILAHGASGTAASMRPYVDALRRRGVQAKAINLPKGKAERAMPVFAEAIAGMSGRVVAGGHSYGGRVASLVAAERPLEGLLLLSYPLHRPGHPEELRTEHWPRIRCPVLLLSGEADPFARIDLLRRSARLLHDAELITFPRVGHGLQPVLDEAMDLAAAFVRRLRQRSTRAG